MATIVIFSGGGDYTDPWHPFAETSALVAGLLEEDAHDIRIVDTVAGLDGALDAADLLVVNAGGGLEAHPLDDRLIAVLGAYRGPMLALHVAAALLPGARGVGADAGWPVGSRNDVPPGPRTVHRAGRVTASDRRRLERADDG